MNFSFDVLFPFIVDELMGKTNKSFIKPKLVRKHIGVLSTYFPMNPCKL